MPTILSRFDCIFIVKDEHNERRDMVLNSQICLLKLGISTHFLFPDLGQTRHGHPHERCPNRRRIPRRRAEPRAFEEVHRLLPQVSFHDTHLFTFNWKCFLPVVAVLAFRKQRLKNWKIATSSCAAACASTKWNPKNAWTYQSLSGTSRLDSHSPFVFWWWFLLSLRRYLISWRITGANWFTTPSCSILKPKQHFKRTFYLFCFQATRSRGPHVGIPGQNATSAVRHGDARRRSPETLPSVNVGRRHVRQSCRSV